MEAREFPNSKSITSLHYVAAHGSEALIAKVLELPKGWKYDQTLPPSVQKYKQYLDLTYIVEQTTIDTRSILKGRPGLKKLMEKLEPPPNPPKAPSDKRIPIIEILETRNKELLETNKYAVQARNKLWSRRNTLAVEESERLLDEIKDLKGRVTKYANEAQVLEYVKKEVLKLVHDTEKDMRDWYAYWNRPENGYAGYVCKEAAEIFQNIYEDLQILN